MTAVWVVIAASRRSGSLLDSRRMDQVEGIEVAITSLAPAEYRRLVDWFRTREQTLWSALPARIPSELRQPISSRCHAGRLAAHRLPRFLLTTSPRAGKPRFFAFFSVRNFHAVRSAPVSTS